MKKESLETIIDTVLHDDINHLVNLRREIRSVKISSAAQILKLIAQGIRIDRKVKRIRKQVRNR